MDRSWIDCNRKSKAYLDGVESFFSFAFANKDANAEIYCPCSKCANRYCYTLPIVRFHVDEKGFCKGYKIWTHHGENAMGGLYGTTDSKVDDLSECNVSESNPMADMIAMIHEGRGFPIMEDDTDNDYPAFEDTTEPFGSEKAFYKRLQEAEMPLYEDCPEGITELSFIVQLLHMKQLNGWSNYSFTMFVKFLKTVFPRAKIPKSYYQANKITTDLGFKYETWDACPKGCMLFRDGDKNLDKCNRCHEPRYEDVSSDGEQGKKIAVRQVRYFPLKPRLQKLFWSKHTAPLMKWHVNGRVDDGVMRHPADSRAWKLFDERYPSFAGDGRNIRLGLAADGFNPHGNMSTAHSTWPIVLIPYNLPPWKCMKQSNFILSTLIDGPKAPGNNIDVFLQPLIEELKELWNDGVATVDSSSNEVFQLHAALMWTISDFPAFGDLSGCVNKGEFACPYCSVDSQATWLQEGHKFCYWGHRRFLELQNKWRYQKSSFDGKVDTRPPPAKLSGSQVLQQLNEFGVETVYKKEDFFRKREREQWEKEVAKQTHQKVVKKHNYKKRSIFFELPYWEHNAIRHNLDIMHVEKNMCDNVLYTLLGTRLKTKDNLNARRDLERMNIRHDLHLQPRGGNLEYMPPADFTLNRKDKVRFLKFLRDIRVPDGYSSSISRCINLEKVTVHGLKSHDSHILMQQLLPIAIRNLLPDHVVRALIELSNCFAILCSGVNSISDLEKFQDRVAVMLCRLERIFPPAFFDVMEHLPVHLADELLLGGSAFYRWMYPIERYLKTLKGFVRNHARPEASIAKSVLVEECMTFCSRYLDDTTETKSNRPLRNDDGENGSGRGVGKRVPFELDPITKAQAHRYILANTAAVKPFMNLHLEELKTRYPRPLQSHLVSRLHSEQFPTWFEAYVRQQPMDVQALLPDEIKSLALGPLATASRLHTYIVRGCRYRIKEVDRHKKTQNSGVMLKATQLSYSSSKDTKPVLDDITFYGQLTDIFELQYLHGMKFVLFKCDWVDNYHGGKRVDKFDYTLVNFSKLLYQSNHVNDEPFILALQADQVFYVQDNLDPDWHIVVRAKPRDRFDTYSIPQVDPHSRQQLDDSQPMTWVRQGGEGAVIDTSVPDDLDNDEESNEEEGD